MDDIIFYQPPLASKSLAPCLPGLVTASNTPGGPPASLSDRQTASELNQQNRISKDQMHKSRDVSNLSQKGHASDRRCRNDTVQEQAIRNSLNSNGGDAFLEIDKLLSGI